MKPDVIVSNIGQTILFKTQSNRVSEWLREHYHMTTENPNGHTEFRVHPARCKRIIEELKTAGFNVSTL